MEDMDGTGTDYEKIKKVMNDKDMEKKEAKEKKENEEDEIDKLDNESKQSDAEKNEKVETIKIKLNSTQTQVLIATPPGPLRAILTEENDEANCCTLEKVYPESPLYGSVHPDDRLVAVDGVSVIGKSCQDVRYILNSKRDHVRILTVVPKKSSLDIENSSTKAKEKVVEKVTDDEELPLIAKEKGSEIGDAGIEAPTLRNTDEDGGEKDATVGELNSKTSSKIQNHSNLIYCDINPAKARPKRVLIQQEGSSMLIGAVLAAGTCLTFPPTNLSSSDIIDDIETNDFEIKEDKFHFYPFHPKPLIIREQNVHDPPVLQQSLQPSLQQNLLTQSSLAAPLQIPVPNAMSHPMAPFSPAPGMYPFLFGSNYPPYFPGWPAFPPLTMQQLPQPFSNEQDKQIMWQQIQQERYYKDTKKEQEKQMKKLEKQQIKQFKQQQHCMKQELHEYERQHQESAVCKCASDHGLPIDFFTNNKYSDLDRALFLIAKKKKTVGYLERVVRDKERREIDIRLKDRGLWRDINNKSSDSESSNTFLIPAKGKSMAVNTKRKITEWVEVIIATCCDGNRKHYAEVLMELIPDDMYNIAINQAIEKKQLSEDTAIRSIHVDKTIVDSIVMFFKYYISNAPKTKELEAACDAIVMAIFWTMCDDTEEEDSDITDGDTSVITTAAAFLTAQNTKEIRKLRDEIKYRLGFSKCQYLKGVKMASEMKRIPDYKATPSKTRKVSGTKAPHIRRMGDEDKIVQKKRKLEENHKKEEINDE